MPSDLEEVKKVKALNGTRIPVRIDSDQSPAAKAIDLTKKIHEQLDAVFAWLESSWNGPLQVPGLENLYEILLDPVEDNNKWIVLDPCLYSENRAVHPLINLGCATPISNIYAGSVAEKRIKHNMSVFNAMVLNALKVCANSTKPLPGLIQAYSATLVINKGLNAVTEISKILASIVDKGLCISEEQLAKRIDVEDNLTTFPNLQGLKELSYGGYSYGGTPKETIERRGLYKAPPSDKTWVNNVINFIDAKLSHVKALVVNDINQIDGLELCIDRTEFSSAGYCELFSQAFCHYMDTNSEAKAAHIEKCLKKMDWLKMNNSNSSYAIKYLSSYSFTDEYSTNINLRGLFRHYVNKNYILDYIKKCYKLTNTTLDRYVDYLNNISPNVKAGTTTRRKFSLSYVLESKSEVFNGIRGFYSFENRRDRDLVLPRVLINLSKTLSLKIVKNMASDDVKYFNPYLLGLPETEENSEMLKAAAGEDLPEWAKPSRLFPFLKEVLEVTTSSDIEQVSNVDGEKFERVVV